jgi:hypothetical protein
MVYCSVLYLTRNGALELNTLASNCRIPRLAAISLQPTTALLTITQSLNYLTTDGHSASISWCQATISKLGKIFLSFLIHIIFKELRICYYGEPSLRR